MNVKVASSPVASSPRASSPRASSPVASNPVASNPGAAMLSNPKSLAVTAPQAAATEREAPMLASRVNEAVDYVLQQRLLQPQVAIILGSGLGGLADDVQHESCIPYCEIPHFKLTHAIGHAGRFLLGYLAGMPVVVMQGRYHRYEGHSNATVSFPVRVMQALGARTLIVTNAAGGLNPRYRAGDLMLVDQHIDCLWQRPGRSPAAGDDQLDVPGSRALGALRYLSHIYDADLLDRAKHIALRHALNVQRGVYVATLGPTYETRSEYRMFRGMGGDAVGMSTVPEVMTARELAMRVLAISVITNVACTDQAQGTTHDEVVQCGRQVEPELRRLVHQLLEEMAGPAD